jgi:hypothetical protein
MTVSAQYEGPELPEVAAVRTGAPAGDATVHRPPLRTTF